MTGSTFEVLIIGAGFGGLGMAAQLTRAGVDGFVILERADDIGGVWRDNDYPGAACDTEAHLYCYSFAPHLRVSRMYAGRDELRGYVNRLADEFTLRDHLRLGEEVVSAQWHDDSAEWLVRTGRGEEYRARFLVTAWGQLGTPYAPDVRGLEQFHGETFHSARWRHDIDLTGKRVISIGNAASAVQYVPEIAPIAASLEVFQRSANWIMPRNQIVFTDEQLDAYEASPELFEQSRHDLHEFRENGFRRTRVGTEEQAAGMAIALAHLESQVPDPVLRAKLTPTYEFGCKRILRSDDYFPALMRDNVELVTEAIDSVVPTGVRTVDGVVHEADVIVFGTGFRSQAFQGDTVVTGRDGADLAERWSEGAEAYLGMTVDGFPNLFMLYGPNTNLNHNSIMTMLETQQDYVVAVLDALLQQRGAAIEVRGEVLAAFNERVQTQLQGSAFTADCSSWYKDASGKVVNNWSGTVEEYRALADEWQSSDYLLTEAAS
ncbi:MAG: NAD(P)/FAD-dependent oxidoreductase [Subtercola sp.]|nr:NAD(P)/FAD-dependent oxidoreductase [Subtercola sp.]